MLNICTFGCVYVYTLSEGSTQEQKLRLHKDPRLHTGGGSPTLLTQPCHTERAWLYVQGAYHEKMLVEGAQTLTSDHTRNITRRKEEGLELSNVSSCVREATTRRHQAKTARRMQHTYRITAISKKNSQTLFTRRRL